MILSILKRLSKNESGATAIEYGLIAGLIAVAMMTALMGFASETKNMLGRVTSSVANATGN